MKKVMLPGLAAGAAMLVVGMLVGQLFGLVFPDLNSEYINPALFRPWADPLMSLYFFAPIILGLVLAFIWEKVKHVFKEKGWKRGACFGVKYWLVTLPGMIMTYGTFQVSLLMVVSWSVTGLLQGIVSGLVLERMNK